ncbi:hypothetical protein HALLA_21160 (plasmid) [Halostagnicola larsenii XH-48]|uniref:SHOCT domain-containing protein n=1 Tax=Halostagnicola larsenii XH-48 TaxID=797299 RepID=W0JYS8_9EURY|nr:SHOCT domain-containing protein [Halostagnicola larsenii]AHG02417.1 hypothetical protein HALLA_21160 [Halostagnicola larsenii XH-48]
MERTSLLERVSEHIAEVIGLLSMGVAVVGATLGIEWVLLVGAIGFIVGMPLAFLLEPDTETTAERTGEADGDSQQQDDPIDALKTAYANGTIAEEEFEQKVSRLLESEDADLADEAGVRTREPSTVEGTDRGTDTDRLEHGRLDREST